MTKQTVNVLWNSQMAFTVDVNGYKIPIDADESVGGTGTLRLPPCIFAI